MAEVSGSRPHHYTSGAPGLVFETWGVECRMTRGLVEKPEDWPWSSFSHYGAGAKATVEIESQWTAARRADQLPEHLRYAEKAN